MTTVCQFCRSKCSFSKPSSLSLLWNTQTSWARPGWVLHGRAKIRYFFVGLGDGSVFSYFHIFEIRKCGYHVFTLRKFRFASHFLIFVPQFSRFLRCENTNRGLGFWHWGEKSDSAFSEILLWVNEDRTGRGLVKNGRELGMTSARAVLSVFFGRYQGTSQCYVLLVPLVSDWRDFFKKRRKNWRHLDVVWTLCSMLNLRDARFLQFSNFALFNLITCRNRDLGLFYIKLSIYICVLKRQIMWASFKNFTLETKTHFKNVTKAIQGVNFIFSAHTQFKIRINHEVHEYTGTQVQIHLFRPVFLPSKSDR